MRIIKIGSCFQCAGEMPYRNRVMINCPIVNMDNPSYEPHIHDDCPLDKYPDIEAIKELCTQPYDSYRELQADILALIS